MGNGREVTNKYGKFIAGCWSLMFGLNFGKKSTSSDKHSAIVSVTRVKHKENSL